MDIKEQEQIESILKKSADSLEMKPFAERWEEIKSELEFDRGEKISINEQVPILAGQSNVNGEFSDKPLYSKKKFIVLSVCLFLVTIMAIFIPISVYKSKPEPVYFDPTDLIGEIVSEDVFFEGIKNSNISLVDLNEYNCEEFTLLKSASGEVQGGKFSFTDENRLVYVTFYSTSVQVSKKDYNGAEKYQLANTEILYKRCDGDTELIEYKALTEHKNIIYELDYLSFSDDIITFFDGFFS